MKKCLSILICIILMIINTGCTNTTNIKKISTYETELNATKYFNNLTHNVINKHYPDITYETKFNNNDSNVKCHYMFIYFNNDHITLSLYNTNEDNDYGYEKYYIAYQNEDNDYWNIPNDIYLPTDLEKLVISSFISDVTGKEIQSEDIEKIFEVARNKIETEQVISNLKSSREFNFTGYVNNIKNAPFKFYIRNNGTVYNRYTIRYEFGSTTNDYNNFTINSLM